MSRKSLKKLSNESLEAIASRFRALGEASRLRIVQVLQGGERSVGQLVQLTGLSQPNVSRHLQVLVTAKLVGRRKAGLQVLYRVVDENLGQLCLLICQGIQE